MSCCSGHVLPYKGQLPVLGPDVFIAAGACVIGDVHIGAGSSLWFNVVVRGDVHRVRIGEQTNIQDGSVCHVTRETGPLHVGNRVTVGHGAVLHACTVGDEALVGMGAVVLDGAVVEPRAMVAAGAVVPPGKVVKTGELWGGSPARKMRDLKPEEAEYLLFSGPYYARLAADYMPGQGQE